jgi:hypothetical protein
MPAQPGPWHGVVSGSPLEYSLASLEPKLSHGGDDDGGPAMFTVGKDDDYYDFAAYYGIIRGQIRRVCVVYEIHYLE